MQTLPFLLCPCAAGLTRGCDHLRCLLNFTIWGC